MSNSDSTCKADLSGELSLLNIDGNESNTNNEEEAANDNDKAELSRALSSLDIGNDDMNNQEKESTNNNNYIPCTCNYMRQLW